VVVSPHAARPEGTGETGELLRQARAGSAEALGRLLDGCRAYLLLIANQELDADLRPKAAPSDLVQDTFQEAQHAFAKFEGDSAAALRRWLRSILRHNLADLRTRYRDAAVRQLSREKSLDAPPGTDLPAQLTADTPSPSERAVAAEEQEALRRALERLPEDQRRAIELRNHQGLSFAAVGEALDRSAAAAWKLWFRAVERLGQELKARHEHS
jgi:RNA polymerase sigma-70 factor (ECF subfamily)